MNEDSVRLRLKLPSSSKLRGLLHKSSLSLLGSTERLTGALGVLHVNASETPKSNEVLEGFDSHEEQEDYDSRSFLSVPLVKTRSRAVSSASDNSFKSLTRWASQSSLSVSLKNTWEAIGGYTKERLLEENESGVAFNESEASEDESPQLDPTRWLPSELIVHILQNLDFKSLVACMQVSTKWNSVASMNAVWRELYLHQYGWRVVDDLPPGVSWKMLFETKLELEYRWKNAEVDPKVLVGHTDSVYCVQFDDNKVVTGSRDRTIRVWSAKTGALLRTVGVGIKDSLPSDPTAIYHSGSILCLSYDDEIMISGSSDSSCIIWDMNKFKPIQQVYRHSAGVLDVCLSAKYVVSCSKDSTLCVWDRTDPKFALRWRFQGHRGPVNAVQLDGDFIVSAGGDATVKLWSASTGKLLREFHGHTRGLACVQICTTARRVVSGANDDTIRVWDLDTGDCLHTLEGHMGLVRSVHIFNNRIVSGSYDQTIKVWDLHTGELLSDIEGWHGSWIFSAKADAKRIVTTSLGVKPVIMYFGKGLNQELLDYIR